MLSWILEVQITCCYFQFTDLEEEFVEFRHKAELEQSEKEKELAHLRGQLKTLEQRNKHAGRNAKQLPVQTMFACAV
jgi:hypothetical protein